MYRPWSTMLVDEPTWPFAPYSRRTAHGVCLLLSSKSHFGTQSEAMQPVGARVDERRR